MCRNSLYFGPEVLIGTTLRPKYTLFRYMDPLVLSMGGARLNPNTASTESIALVASCGQECLFWGFWDHVGFCWVPQSRSKIFGRPLAHFLFALIGRKRIFFTNIVQNG